MGLLIISLLITIGHNSEFYARYIGYKLGRAAYQDFVAYGGHSGSRYSQIEKLADYVRERTSPTDRIYYWSGDVQVYYLADRRSSIDIIWPLYAEATGPYQRIFAQQTKYIIVGESNSVPRPDWLYAELGDKYQLEHVIEDQEIYRRVD
jgi:hypothetical protein